MITPRFIRIARYSPILMLVLAVIIGFAVSRDSVRSNPVIDQDGTQVFVLSTKVGLQAVPSGSLVGPVESILISSGDVASDIAAPVSYLFSGVSIYPDSAPASALDIISIDRLSSFYDTPNSEFALRSRAPSVNGTQNAAGLIERLSTSLNTLPYYMTINTINVSYGMDSVLAIAKPVEGTITPYSLDFGLSLITWAGADNASGFAVIKDIGTSEKYPVDNTDIQMLSNRGEFTGSGRYVDLHTAVTESLGGQTAQIASDVTSSGTASRIGVLGDIVADSVGIGTISDTAVYSNLQSIKVLGLSALVFLMVLGHLAKTMTTPGSPPSDKKWRMIERFGAPNFAATAA